MPKASARKEAARDKLYFDRLRATDEELARQGVPFDEKLYQELNRWVDEHLAWKSRRLRGRR